MPWKYIFHDSTKDIVNMGAWHYTKRVLISDGISLYVPIKTATLFEHYTRNDQGLCHCEGVSEPEAIPPLSTDSRIQIASLRSQ